MHHDHAVARQVHVQFEAVGAEREAVVERRDRVFRRQRAATAMGKHQRAGRHKKQEHDSPFRSL